MKLTMTMPRVAGRLAAVEALKVCGLVAMLWAHLNRFLTELVPYEVWYHFGRLAFPCFAIALGIGLRGGALWSRENAALRLLWVATAAQVAWAGTVVVGLREPLLLNVVFTMFAGTLLVIAERCEGGFRVAHVLLAFGVTCFSEYGFVGAALVWAVCYQRWAWASLLLGVLSVWTGSVVPMFVLPALWFADRELGDARVPMPRYTFAVAYVAQAALLSVLSLSLGA